MLETKIVKKGDTIQILGQIAPSAEILVTIYSESEKEFFAKTKADSDGVYLQNFNTAELEYGPHTTKSKAGLEEEISGYSLAAGFQVGKINVDNDGSPQSCDIRADLNTDCRVNLVDFSIAAYWYKRPISESFGAIEATKLNGDGKVDLVDFSIMAYHWTG